MLIKDFDVALKVEDEFKEGYCRIMLNDMQDDMVFWATKDNLKQLRDHLNKLIEDANPNKE